MASPADALTQELRFARRDEKKAQAALLAFCILALAGGSPGADVQMADGKTATGQSTVVGNWRGQTQFQANRDGVRVPDAQSVAPLLLTFGVDGKVTGSSPDNGCQLLGIWAPGLTPQLFALDVSLKRCRDARFNQRYRGTLTARIPERQAQLSLIANTPPLPGQPFWRFDVSATLRQ